ncbi:Pentapeptide repeat-containing protein [Balamuthia mandrillaris]
MFRKLWSQQPVDDEENNEADGDDKTEAGAANNETANEEEEEREGLTVTTAEKQKEVSESAALLELARREAALRHRELQLQQREERLKNSLFFCQPQEAATSSFSSDSQSRRVKLNVGGTIFHTSTTTLEREPHSLLACLASGRWKSDQQENDEDGEEKGEGKGGGALFFFLDRDPDVFAIVLAYLRAAGSLSVDDLLQMSARHNISRRRLLVEADYLMLEQLSTLLRGEAEAEEVVEETEYDKETDEGRSKRRHRIAVEDLPNPDLLTRREVVSLLCLKGYGGSTNANSGTTANKQTLRGVRFCALDLSRLCFNERAMPEADFRCCNLHRTHFQRAELSEALLQGANLSLANLRKANLKNANLEGADLRGANLQGANLTGACLHGADLRGADVSEAVMASADLRGSRLTAADLKETDLRQANLEGADLRGANLKDAVLTGAKLGGNNGGGGVLDAAEGAEQEEGIDMVRQAILRRADRVPASPSLHKERSGTTLQWNGMVSPTAPIWVESEGVFQRS